MRIAGQERDHPLLLPLTAFRTPEAPRILTRTVHGSALALTDVSGPAGHGLTDAIPPSRSCLVQLRLRESPGVVYFAEGRPVTLSDPREGAIQFHDLRRDPRAEVVSPFHVMHVAVALAVLDEVMQDISLPRIDALQSEPGHCHRDTVIEHLLRAMRPALLRPGEVSALYLDQASTALCAHLVHHYTGVLVRPLTAKGGLAPWQKRIAEELLQTRLDLDIGLPLLAESCGLSVRHFTRAFKQSFGVTAYQYRLHCRLAHAKQLLKQNQLPIIAIAGECGFASQSHLSRAFHACTGMSPGEWRRRHADAPLVSLPHAASGT